MIVEVLYFAVVRELVGKEGDKLELPAEITSIGAFRTFIEGHESALAGRLASVRIARNEEFANDGDSLAEGDVLALIPPVAGG